MQKIIHLVVAIFLFISSNAQVKKNNAQLFTKFWNNFKNAILQKDSVAIANNMVHYPFTDYSTPNRGGEEFTLTSENEETFRWNYSKIFLPHVVEAIKNNKYRAYNSQLDIKGVSMLKKGQFILEPSTNEFAQYYDLIFALIKGQYKLISIAYYQ